MKKLALKLADGGTLVIDATKLGGFIRAALNKKETTLFINGTAVNAKLESENEIAKLDNYFDAGAGDSSLHLATDPTNRNETR